MSHWAGGAFWTGNLDARAISGIPKPRLLTELDWSDGDCQLRAELMALAPASILRPQLAAIMKLLCLVEDGEHLDIAAPLHRHARRLIATCDNVSSPRRLHSIHASSRVTDQHSPP